MSKKNRQRSEAENSPLGTINPEPPIFLPAHWIPAVLVLLTMALYINALSGDFVMDDLYLIVNNTLTDKFSSLFTFFLKPYWAGNVAENAFVYRPVVNATFVATKLLAGNHAFWFKLTNVLLHAANTVLVYLLILRLSRRNVLALFTALLFALHPIQTEAVNGIVNRTDLMALFFCLAAFLWYLNYAGSRFVIPFTVALFCKENAFALLPMFPLLDFADNRKPRFSRYGWLSVTVVTYFCMRYAAIGALGGGGGPAPELDNPIATIDPTLRVLTALNVLGRYILLLVFPKSLSPDYSLAMIPTVTTLLDPLVLLALAMNGALAVLVWRSWKGGRYLLVAAAAFYFFPMALVANIFLPITNIMAERFLYLPSVGIFFLVAFGFYRLYLKAPRAVFALFALVMTGLAMKTYARNYDWHDELSLFRAAEKVSGQSARVHFNLGNAEFKAGNKDEALRQYQKALEIYPGYVLALSNQCVAYANEGNFSAARNSCETALHYNPDFTKARESLDFIKAQGH